MAVKGKHRALITRGLLGHGVKISKGLQPSSVLKCADNSGARDLRLVQVIGYKGR